MKQDTKKSYKAFVGHHRGVAVDFDGNKKRNEWIDLGLDLAFEEELKAICFESENVGSGYMPVIGSSHVDNLVARVLHVLDAANTNEALKDLVKEKIWAWFDEKVTEVSANPNFKRLG